MQQKAFPTLGKVRIYDDEFSVAFFHGGLLIT